MTPWLASTGWSGGQTILAVRGLPDLADLADLAARRVRRRPLSRAEADADLVSPVWAMPSPAAGTCPPGRLTAARPGS